MVDNRTGGTTPKEDGWRKMYTKYAKWYIRHQVLILIGLNLLLGVAYVFFPIPDDNKPIPNNNKNQVLYQVPHLFRDIIPNLMASSIVFTFLYVVYDIFRAPSIERARRDSSASQDERDAITNDQADLPALPSFQEYLQNLKWYTLYGLDEQTTQDKTFQDFELNDANPNVIKFLWAFADERENDEISSNINQENGVSFLHIEFQNKTSFGSNICILPKDRKACQTGNAKYLTFELRIPNTHHSNQPNNNQNIALNFRIVDGQLQHWCYQGQIPNVFGANYTLLTEKYQSILSDQHWVKFGLSLQDKDIWQLFEVDGNYLYGDKNHNFTILAAVIFEFGIGGRHGSGSGAIDIRKIALRTSLPKDTSIIQ